MFSAVRHLGIQILFNSAVFLKIFLNVPFRLFAAYMQIFRQSETAHTVDYAEIHRLGAAAVQRSNLVIIQFEYAGRGHPMDVIPVVERGNQILIAGKMRHDPQLDL